MQKAGIDIRAFSLRAWFICSAPRFLAAGLLAACNRSETLTAPDSSGGAPALQYGTKLNFASGGNSEPYKVSGWAKTEEKFTWSEGTSAVLRIPVVPTNDSVALTMKIAALVKSPELPAQPVEVYINDHKIVEWLVSDTAEYTLAIPHDITKLETVLLINIRTPKATSPKALGLNADPRVLGICCFDLELTKS